jgi:hypothetical protein
LVQHQSQVVFVQELVALALVLQPGDPGYSSTVQHGLIIPLRAFVGSVNERHWGCSGSLVSGADGTAYGTGIQNTLDIVNGCTDTATAAYFCQNLVLDGFSDWFLPSRDEVKKIYLNRVSLNLSNISRLNSSSEIDAAKMWAITFDDGMETYSFKAGPSLDFRPCRYF